MRVQVLVVCGLLLAGHLAAEDKVKDVIGYNQIDKLKGLIATKTINLNSNEGNGYTPLHLAVEANNFVMVDLLLEAGADVNADFHNTVREFGTKTDSPSRFVATSFTPLAIALNKGDPTMILRLLKAGANPNSLYDPRAFSVKDEPVTVLRKAVDLGNSRIAAQLLSAGATLETAPGKNDALVLLDLAIDSWRVNYFANKISLEAQNLGQSSSSVGAVAGLIGTLGSTAFSKNKVLESSNIIRLIVSALKVDYGDSKRIQTIFQPRKWDSLSAMVMKTSAGEFLDRGIEIDLALILGDYSRFQQALADNSPLSAMTMVYLIQYDRIKEYQFLGSLGIPSPSLLQPLAIDKEIFPNYLVFAYSQGATNMLAQFQKTLNLTPVK